MITKTLVSAPLVKDPKTYIPLRVMPKSLNADTLLDWNGFKSSTLGELVQTIERCNPVTGVFLSIDNGGQVRLADLHSETQKNWGGSVTLSDIDSNWVLVKYLP